MRYIDEFRDGRVVQALAKKISSVVSKEWVLMEICGGQTHSIITNGLDELLPQSITLVHGPGCPVCVTPLEIIDKAVEIASFPNVIFTSFGDMLRVPGSVKDLLRVKSEGGDIRIVYSPLDALKIARQNPEKEVVFFAVGFETTAPPNAMAVLTAQNQGITNFSILCSHVLVPPAIEAILSSPTNHVQAFLAAGHVCTVMGYEQYIPIAEKYRTPIVVTGFEPVDIMEGILLAVQQLEEGRFVVENQYSRSVKKEGNAAAKKILDEVYDIIDRTWRGIGVIPRSGFKLKNKYERYDAEIKFDVKSISTKESPLCIAGEILQGLKKPIQCSAFAKECTPEHPLGAPMVSSEGACAAYYHTRKL